MNAQGVDMFTIALVGPDGAGKTTISQQILATLPMRVKYLYMGVNVDSSNRMLPTTRWAAYFKRKMGEKTGGEPAPARSGSTSKSILKRAFASVRSGLRLVNRLGEESYRQCLTWFYLLRGNIVLYDRHFFFDYYAYDIAPTRENRPLHRRIHGYFLQHVLPKPDLVIYLDAPAEVLFSRKGEGTVADLERRRQEYLQARGQVRRFEVVDATQSMDQVTKEVASLIWKYHESRQKSAAERDRQML
jgi:thymidylate kinase